MVPEKKTFGGLYPLGSHLGNVTSIMLLNFHFYVPKGFDIKGSLTFAVCKCPWFLEKIKVNQLFFYAQCFLFWIKYSMIVELVFHF